MKTNLYHSIMCKSRFKKRLLHIILRMSFVYSLIIFFTIRSPFSASNTIR
jgi:hypothetical protein